MSKIRDGILGVAIGDMLGVPVEFMRRRALDEAPVVGLREHGSHDQPLGAWSDDTSQTLALADALSHDFSLQRIAENFIDWWLHKKWTSHGYLFDIGQRTLLSFNELRVILASGDYEAFEYLHYDASVHTNGNGSLMRVLPLYFYLKDKGLEANFQTIWRVSALTHPHVRAAIACALYLVLIDELMRGGDKHAAYAAMQIRIRRLVATIEEAGGEAAHFERILSSDITKLTRDEIESTGYVIHTLEAAVWSFLTTNSYEEAVLRAVNLGDDTDTVGAVTGGLAGIYYGIDTAPEEWLATIANRELIEKVCAALDKRVYLEHSKTDRG